MTVKIVRGVKICASGTEVLGEEDRLATSGMPKPPTFTNGMLDPDPNPKGIQNHDPVCRLALSAARYLIPADKNGFHIDGIVLGSMAGCLLSDLDYWHSFQHAQYKSPSPKKFRYTLPSIAIGEVCIAHKILGLNLFITAGEVSGLTALIEAVDWIKRRMDCFYVAAAIDVDGPLLRRIQGLDDAPPFHSAAFFFLLFNDVDQRFANFPEITDTMIDFVSTAPGKPSGLLGNLGMQSLWDKLVEGGQGEQNIFFRSYDGYGAGITLTQSHRMKWQKINNQQ